ncbi:MAG TPA: CBS domain-containing protein [Angustibacter sp.]|nr:CBS domain-containing protein [Angustibacter sp.]
MLARDLAEQVPVVRRSDNALEVARLIASLRLAGVVVADGRGEPVALLQGSQVLRIVVPRYVREDPRLAHAYDEAGADELCAGLGRRTVGDLLDDDEVTPSELPQVQPQDTLVEIASVMVREHSSLVVVRDDEGVSSGVVTLPRVMAAVLRAAGREDERVRQTLLHDLADLDSPHAPIDAPDTDGEDDA